MGKALKFLKEQEKACNDYLGAFTEQDLIDYEGDDELEAVKKCLIEVKEAISELEEAMNKTPENIITKLRNSFSHATVVYTRGSCGQLYKILKEIFPNAEAYENGDHVITKIGDKFWDIKGEIKRTDGFKPCKPNNTMLSHYFGNDIKYIQCPQCDEVFYCGDDVGVEKENILPWMPKDNA